MQFSSVKPNNKKEQNGVKGRKKKRTKESVLEEKGISSDPICGTSIQKVTQMSLPILFNK